MQQATARGMHVFMEACQHCGGETQVLPCGVKHYCQHCGGLYPHGDCSD